MRWRRHSAEHYRHDCSVPDAQRGGDGSERYAGRGRPVLAGSAAAESGAGMSNKERIIAVLLAMIIMTAGNVVLFQVVGWRGIIGLFLVLWANNMIQKAGQG